MNDFAKRLEKDRIMKKVLIEFIEKFLKGKVFIKEVGQEVNLLDIHKHIRLKNDINHTICPLYA
ncbi:MAG: hypothetical protein QW735_04385 [archaeon]